MRSSFPLSVRIWLTWCPAAIIGRGLGSVSFSSFATNGLRCSVSAKVNAMVIRLLKQKPAGLAVIAC